MWRTATISWLSPLLRKGWRKPLEAEDLLPLPPPLTCGPAYAAFLRGLAALPAVGGEERNGGGASAAAAASGAGAGAGATGGPPGALPSMEQRLRNTRALLRLVWVLHGPALRVGLLLMYAYQLLVFTQPLLLRELTQQLIHGRPGDGRIWLLPLFLFLSPLVGSVCKAQAQLRMIRIQISLRTQLTAAVYRKCLALSTGARAEMPSGRVVNLMSADVSKICDIVYPQLTFIAAAPLAVLVALFLLWFQIGWATLVGLAVLLLSSPVSNIAVRATQRHRNDMLAASDQRMKLVGQFLAGVRVTKMYDWARPQAERITERRSEELRALRNMIPSKVAMQTLLYVLPQLAGVLSFLAVGLTNPQALTAARVFSSLVLFQIMRFPLLTLSTGLVELGAAIISARRLTAFMAMDEQVEYVQRLTAGGKKLDGDDDDDDGDASGPEPAGHDEANGRSAYGNGHGHVGVAKPSSSTVRQAAAPAPADPPLADVGPGVTIRAPGGFRWAAPRAPPTAAEAGAAAQGAAGSSGGGGTSGGPGRRLQRVRTAPRPFMEVVDEAGESLASGAVALGIRLQRAFTRLRDLDELRGSSSSTPRLAAAARGDGTEPSPQSPAGGRLAVVGADDREEEAGERTRLIKPSAPLSSGDVLIVAGGSSSPSSPSFSDGSSSNNGGRLRGSSGAGGSGPAGVGGAPLKQQQQQREEAGAHGDGGSGGREWTPAGAFCLGAIDIRVKPGELLCVVGRVGSGKSSLLSAALGDMELLSQAAAQRQAPAAAAAAASGDAPLVALAGRVAYTAQQAWVMNARLVDNVTMGRPLDERLWERCVKACALGPDLALLPAGRDTEIGEKGVNLSGGQKQRLALARAMYQESDIYLLDDPLSAVDVHVGTHIFHHLIRGALRSAAVVLVTNAVHFLHAADRILVLDAGREVIQGSYDECLAEPTFAALCEEWRATQKRGAEEDGQEEEDGARAFDSGASCSSSSSSSSSPENPTSHQAPLQPSRSADLRDLAGDGQRGANADAAEAAADANHPLLAGEVNGSSGKEGGEGGGKGTPGGKAPSSSSSSGGGERSGTRGVSTTAPLATAPSESEARKGRITVIEDREHGQVKRHVYATYLGAFSWAAALAMLLFWAAEQGTRLATNTWLAHWSRGQTAREQSGASGGASGFAGVYLLLGGAYALATFLRSTTNNLGSYRASKLLHERTLAALMAAPLSFFEATPIGRILNRLSRDVDEMDYNLALYQQQFGNCLMRLVATLIFLCVLQPAFIGVVVPLTVIYFILQKYFRRSSIELQRIDSVTRSPVYANFSETMAGIDTIRAYRLQERFKARHERLVDTNATAYYNARVADEWLSLRLDLIGAIIVLSIAALNVALRGRGVSPALVALALSEAIDLTSFLNYLVKVSALVESRYNAVERLLSYASLPPEEDARAAARLPPYRPPGLPAWPASGALEFRGVSMSYRAGLDPVIQDVSFKVGDGEHVGIVGRTGSGKSSLIVALYRLVEPQAGQILLDGIDLRGLGLSCARTAVTAIPQEPVLFSGSVRTNLDPWGRHSDPEMWEALGVVALRDHVRALGGLSAPVAESGANLSVGQRQLVCVARSLLRKPRLLVADEATASVDPETDALIQRAVRTHFRAATVLAIAHRLNTVMDADRVLVMDRGRVAEFDAVEQLLALPQSVFGQMVQAAGLAAQRARPLEP